MEGDGGGQEDQGQGRRNSVGLIVRQRVTKKSRTGVGQGTPGVKRHIERDSNSITRLSGEVVVEAVGVDVFGSVQRKKTPCCRSVTGACALAGAGGSAGGPAALPPWQFAWVAAAGLLTSCHPPPRPQASTPAAPRGQGSCWDAWAGGRAGGRPAASNPLAPRGRPLRILPAPRQARLPPAQPIRRPSCCAALPPSPPGKQPLWQQPLPRRSPPHRCCARRSGRTPG